MTKQSHENDRFDERGTKEGDTENSPPIEAPLQREASDAVPIPIERHLDLHTFRPREIPSLLEDYIAEAVRKGYPEVLIIHGKGKGILKKGVHGVLRRHPSVIGFRDAPPEMGSWGATVVMLQRRMDPPGKAKNRDHEADGSASRPWDWRKWFCGLLFGLLSGTLIWLVFF